MWNDGTFHKSPFKKKNIILKNVLIQPYQGTIIQVWLKCHPPDKSMSGLKYLDNHYFVIYWIMIYPVDSVIHLLNNWYLFCIPVLYWFCQPSRSKWMTYSWFFLCYSCDSIDKLRSKLPSLEADLRDSSKFKDLYQFTFNFAKNPGQKSLGKMNLILLINFIRNNY